MNSHWANQYAKQRIDGLMADARGDLLVRQARVDAASASPDVQTVGPTLRARLRIAVGRALGSVGTSQTLRSARR